MRDKSPPNPQGAAAELPALPDVQTAPPKQPEPDLPAINMVNEFRSLGIADGQRVEVRGRVYQVGEHEGRRFVLLNDGKPTYQPPSGIVTAENLGAQARMAALNAPITFRGNFPVGTGREMAGLVIGRAVVSRGTYRDGHMNDCEFIAG
jgi:hypothetical protein